ncbi:muconate/chloromuconate family cycloisomerase [Sphingomonas sp.]|uniref:muconate/chloromuconate family cycloisomerase n=1 Tax=Sphingomonas sp. TaxID=28214 RepID=UPI000DB35F1D|nr:muconate/chloromuconate family cycloisomerase [Sphingomonas sp.]PZU10779.1 MAG: chloromuconate cycloisomerase [Sphingomonas sp.]
MLEELTAPTIAAVGTRIRSVETHIIDLPLKRVHKLSRAVLTHQSYLIVRVLTEDGVEGIGDATVPGGPWWGGEAVEAMQVVVERYLAPLVVGQDLFAINAIMAELDKVAFGNPVAKAAIEMALFDAAGRTLDVPVSHLLGGRINDRVPVLWVLATGEMKPDVAEARAKVDAGLHNRFKIKVGRGDPVDDVKRAVATANAVDLPCAIDLNEAWSFPDIARLLPILEGSRVEMIEQPIPRIDHAGMADLVRRSSLPIMADEGICSPADMVDIVRARAATLVSLKLSKSGGFLKSMAIARMAQATGIGCFGGTALDSPIGTAASLQFCSTIPLAWGSELFMPLLLADDILAAPLDYSDFSVAVPTGPGLGITIDHDKMRHYARTK